MFPHFLKYLFWTLPHTPPKNLNRLIKKPAAASFCHLQKQRFQCGYHFLYAILFSATDCKMEKTLFAAMKSKDILPRILELVKCLPKRTGSPFLFRFHQKPITGPLVSQPCRNSAWQFPRRAKKRPRYRYALHLKGYGWRKAPQPAPLPHRKSRKTQCLCGFPTFPIFIFVPWRFTLKPAPAKQHFPAPPHTHGSAANKAW